MSEIEVDEVLGLVGNVRTEVSAYNTMPGRVVLLVELLLNEGSNVLFNVEFLESLSRDIDSILLHVLRHVRVLDNCLSISHMDKFKI